MPRQSFFENLLTVCVFFHIRTKTLPGRSRRELQMQLHDVNGADIDRIIRRATRRPLRLQKAE